MKKRAALTVSCFILALAILFACASCAPKPSVTVPETSANAVASVEPSATPPVEPSGTPEPSALPTDVSPDEPSAVPSGTPEPSATPTPTVPPSPTPTPVQVTSVTLDVNAVTLRIEQLHQLHCSVAPGSAVDRSIMWRTGNTRVATVDGAGVITAHGAGVTTITATSVSGVTAECEVTVIIPVESMSFANAEVTIHRGYSATQTPDYVPTDATDTFTYSSGNNSVATVNNDGRVTAVGAGVTTIKCVSSSGATATYNVAVDVAVESILIAAQSPRGLLGETLRFTVRVHPSDATDQTFTLSASGATILDNGSAQVTASGTVTITATAANGVIGTRDFTGIDPADFANRVLALVNSARSDVGLDPMVLDDTVQKIAVLRAQETVVFYSHTRPDGRTCFTAFDEYGASSYMRAENIAYGYMTPEEVMDGWMNSEGHRENILTPELSKLGLGIALNENGRIYWAQNFTD